LKEVSVGQPCDISGIEDYRMLDRSGGIQWPFPRTTEANSDAPEPERRLFSSGEFYHPDKRARFLFETPRVPVETPDKQFPFVLLTGRGTSAQWHTQTRTGKSAVLRQLYPENIYVEVNPADARELEFSSGDMARVVSRRGSIDAKVLVTSTIQAGHVFIPMHYPTVNQLTCASFDSYSRQPSYKMAAVRLEPLSRKS
jgi:assimilatory nitrate reductase catalytic subunit